MLSNEWSQLLKLRAFQMIWKNSLTSVCLHDVTERRQSAADSEWTEGVHVEMHLGVRREEGLHIDCRDSLRASCSLGVLIKHWSQVQTQHPLSLDCTQSLSPLMPMAIVTFKMTVNLDKLPLIRWLQSILTSAELGFIARVDILTDTNHKNHFTCLLSFCF